MGQVFDSNSITPGTVFLAQLASHLKVYIAEKMKDDAVWQRLQVTFNSHEVCRFVSPLFYILPGTVRVALLH